MFLATIVLACMHSLVRYISDELHPFLVVFYRNLFGFIFILPLAYRAGFSGLKTRYPLLTLLRSVSGIIAMVSWFFGLAKVPTTEATALSFTAAIFVALAAFIFLREKMRIRRWAAIGFGLIGVLIVLRPNTENFNPYMLLILISCVFWGLSVTMVKFLTRTDSTTSIVSWMTFLLTMFSLPLAIMHWKLPTVDQFLILICMGILGTLGHLAMAKALSLAETTAVMSIDFMRLIWAAIIGSLFFGDQLDIYTWLGALVIFSSGLYIMFRESKVKQSQ